MAARVAVAVLALLAIGWLVVLERDTRLQARGLAAAAPPRAPGDLARAEADFRAARLLNPDRAPDVGRAIVLRAAGREREAVALLQAVVRREPEQLGAWRALLAISRDGRPAVARRALAAVARLDPINAPPR